MPAATVSFVASSIRMKAPVRAVVGVDVHCERSGEAQRDRADVVQRQLVPGLVALERVDVEDGVDLLDDRHAHCASCA